MKEMEMIDQESFLQIVSPYTRIVIESRATVTSFLAALQPYKS